MGAWTLLSLINFFQPDNIHFAKTIVSFLLDLQVTFPVETWNAPVDSATSIALRLFPFLGLDRDVLGYMHWFMSLLLVMAAYESSFTNLVSKDQGLPNGLESFFSYGNTCYKEKWI